MSDCRDWACDLFRVNELYGVCRLRQNRDLEGELSTTVPDSPPPCVPVVTQLATRARSAGWGNEVTASGVLADSSVAILVGAPVMPVTGGFVWH